MPVIINPFKGVDPTAQAISDVGNAVFGNTGQAELRKQQIMDAQRKNVETINLMNAVKAAGGVQNLGSDATAQSEIIGSGYAPDNFGKLGLMGSAIQNGAAAQPTQNWQVGTGQSYDNTAGAVNAKLAEQARQFNQKPLPAVDANGNFSFATQGNTAGFTPIVSDTDVKGTKLNQNWGSLDTLSPQQQQAVGAAKGGGNQTPHNYVNPNGATSITYDGVTDAQTGQKLVPGGFIANAQGAAKDVGLDSTNTLKTNLQTSIVNNTNFVTQAGAMVDMAKGHPEAFGPVGALRGYGQEAVQTGSTLFNLVGGGGAFQQAQQAAAGAGLQKVLPEMYDPNIPKARAAYYVLLYNYASALTGQSGRSVSDKDVEMAQRALGNPDDLFGSAQNFITKVQTAQTLAQHNADHSRFLLKNGFEATDPNDANYSQNLENVGADQKNISNTAPPVTSAPGAPSGQVGVAPVQIKSDDDYNALPSGAMFLAPDGTTRKKP